MQEIEQTRREAESRRTMKEPSQTGFAITLAVVAVVALAAAGAIGWSVYSSKKVQASSQAQEVKAPANDQSQASATAPKVDPYVGWKTYCIEGTCFKYPSDWTIKIGESKTKGTVSAGISNPSGSVTGDFGRNNPTVSSGMIPSAYIASLDELSMPNANYKVVGEIYTSDTSPHAPVYAVLDNSFAAKQTVGQQPNVEQPARLSFKHGSGYFWLSTPPLQPWNKPVDVDKAKAWFNTDDAKTALLIAKSFYLE